MITSKTFVAVNNRTGRHSVELKTEEEAQIWIATELENATDQEKELDENYLAGYGKSGKLYRIEIIEHRVFTEAEREQRRIADERRAAYKAKKRAANNLRYDSFDNND